MLALPYDGLPLQVLSEAYSGENKAVAFDQIDKVSQDAAAASDQCGCP